MNRQFFAFTVVIYFSVAYGQDGNTSRSFLRSLVKWWNQPVPAKNVQVVQRPSQEVWHTDWKIVPSLKGTDELNLLGDPRDLLREPVLLTSPKFKENLQRGRIVLASPEDEDIEFIDLEQSIVHDPLDAMSLKPGQLYSYGPRTNELLDSFGEFADNTAVHTRYQQAANFNLNPPVRTLFRYIPKNLKNAEQKNLIAIIHGTFAHAGSAFKSKEHADFNAFLGFAVADAEARGIPVDIISWSWSGNNNAADREQSGKNLAHLLNVVYRNYQAIMLLAHSHGCNTINIASHFLNNGVLIDRAIYLACPVRLGDVYTPTARIKNLYNFYSPADKVQWAGSWDDKSYLLGLFNIGSYGNSARRFDTDRKDMNIVNILIKSNGRSQGHSSMRLLLAGLPQLLQKIERDFKGVHHLLASTISEQGLIQEVLVAVDEKNEKYSDITNETQKRNISDLSKAAQAAFNDRFGHDMDYVTWTDYFTAAK